MTRRRNIEAEIARIMAMTEAELREECIKEGTTFEAAVARGRAALERAKMIVAENIPAHLRRMQ
jgi:hypothetical protein